MKNGNGKYKKDENPMVEKVVQERDCVDPAFVKKHKITLEIKPKKICRDHFSIEAENYPWEGAFEFPSAKKMDKY